MIGPSAMTTVGAIVDFLDQVAPPALAAEWDNVGLLLGDRDTPIERLLTCLTLTPNVADEAVAESAQLIVTHHPILFRPVQRLTTATAEGRLLLGLARRGISVYSPHTAWDNAKDGINDALARRLGLTDLVSLRTRGGPTSCKIVVFVPDSDLSRVADALFDAGAGRIGQYRDCSFRLHGTGTFYGSDDTNPTVGQKGRREEVNEWRLEVLCAEENLERALAAMRKAHSYEEPAFDVYPLRTAPTLGEGRIGRLSQAVPLKTFAHTVKTNLKTSTVHVVGHPDRHIECVAIACGAGGEFVPDAVRGGADVLLTGEVRFHDALGADARGLALLVAGHYATERFGLEELATRIQQAWPTLTVWPSRAERDPFLSI
jgi:dinuclear metal center YbgI/SA1388 family protein